MHQLLKDAIREVEGLPEEEQEELGRILLDIAYRKQIDSRLRAAVALGGGMPAEDFYRELRVRYGG